MGDVILFACGGAARHILDSARESPGVPVVFIDSNNGSSIQFIGDDMPDEHIDQFLAYTLAYENRNEIRRAIAGMRIAIIFAVLGGQTGTRMMPVVAQCAHTEGCRVVTIVGLPLEEGRRGRAMAAVPEISEVSDRMIVLDMAMNSKIYPDLRIHRVMNLIANTVMFTTRNIAWLMEGPFFSTFSKKTYTVAYTTDIDPSGAVSRATDASMFDTDPSFGKMIVLVSSEFGTAQIESVYSTVVNMTGIIPDIVKRKDREDTKVLVFLPVPGF